MVKLSKKIKIAIRIDIHFHDVVSIYKNDLESYYLYK